MEDWTSLGQHKRKPEFPIVTRESRRNSRKTTWLPCHRKMRPLPATASKEKSQVSSWSVFTLQVWKLGTLDAIPKVPRHPGLSRGEHRGSRYDFIWATSPLLIATGGSTPVICLEGVPNLPGAPQDEAGLTRITVRTLICGNSGKCYRGTPLKWPYM